ncbi:hypothetical protein IWX90DRAFT_66111 [Phyllosticta citrichinensis]|uniref:Uncharacterized protein n=1 Tax=Phyllosticta citrichinensis TaxID=1130410 RepID=A0ABR1XHJ8_9PEZI
MAAFAQATPTPAAVPTRTRAPSHTKLLPDGPCNHRNTDLGPNAPVCGCQRFWCNDNTTVGGRPVEIPWCVCGHHACFHAAGDPPPASTSVHLENPAPSQTTSFAGRLVMDDAGAQDHGRYGPVDGSQPDPVWNVSKAGWRNPATPIRRTSSGNDPVRNAPQPPVWATGHQVGSFGANPSPLPSIPSICRLGSSDLRLFNNPNNSMSTEVVPSPVLPGMGTSMHATTEELNRVLTTPTFAGGGFHRTLEPHKWREASLDPTIQDSTDGESTRHRPSPSRTFMTQVLASRTARNSRAPRQVPQALEVAPSATELATSPENTPDLRSFDHNVQETRDLLSNLCDSLADVENMDDRADVKREPRNSPEQEGAHASQDGRAESFTTSLRNIPLILQRLAPHLNHLHQHLTSYPNVSTDIRDIQSRVFSLENASFQHIPPEEIMEKFDNLDVRVLELEQRLKDYLAECDFDGSSKDTLVGSDASGHDPKDTIHRLEALEYRMESLEATLPSPSNPWEIEVVLLPWGKDLKGLWFSASEWESGITTGSQSSEERAQSVSSLSSIKAQPLLMSAQRFEKEAIDRISNTSHESASLDEWYPRACGRSGVAYKRLESRGFVRKVQIKDSSAGHIQTRICEEFDSLIDLVNTSRRPLEEEESQMSREEEDYIDLHGLRASILPLRKKRKDSQLLLLGASELVTASLWTAQFLASGVMMRARGGVKRLYMTHGAAYKQLEMGEEDGWTWENIKELPRFSPYSNVYDEGDAHDEPCWDHNPNFDPPRETTTSFVSKLSLRTGRNPSQESSSPGFDSQGNESSGSQATATTNGSKAPMTPQSELPSHAQSLRPARRIERTLSAPMPHLDRQHSQPSASKRRMTVSFNGDEEEEEASRRASLETANARKRRRFQHSSSNASADTHRTSVALIGAGNATRGAFGFTPRRSREPSSPLRSQAMSAGLSTTYAYHGGRGPSVSSGVGVRAGSVAAAAAAVAAAAGAENCKDANTPGNAAYMTPFSGMAEGGGAYSDDLPEGGDTEVDSSGDDEDDEMTDAAADKAADEVVTDADAEMKDSRPLMTAAAAALQDGGGDTDFEGCSGVEGDDDVDDSAFDSDEEMDLVQHFDSDGMECGRREGEEEYLRRSRGLEYRGRVHQPIVDYTDEEAVIEHPDDDDDDDSSSSSGSSSCSSSSLVDRVGGSVAGEPRARSSGEEVVLEREQRSHHSHGESSSSSSDDDEVDLDDDRTKHLYVRLQRPLP